MAPSSIQVTPMMPKNTAPRTHVRMEAGPAMLAAANVARSQPEPTWTLTAGAIRPKRLICCLRWASLASYAPSTGGASGVTDVLTLLGRMRWLSLCGRRASRCVVRCSASGGGRADDVGPRAAQGLDRRGAAEVAGGRPPGQRRHGCGSPPVDAPGADVEGPRQSRVGAPARRALLRDDRRNRSGP